MIFDFNTINFEKNHIIVSLTVKELTCLRRLLFNIYSLKVKIHKTKKYCYLISKTIYRFDCS